MRGVKPHVLDSKFNSDVYNYQVMSHIFQIKDQFGAHVLISLLFSVQATATDYPTKLYPQSAEVMMLQPSIIHNVKPWFSPSHSYVDVWTRITLPCGSEHSLPVYYSVPTVVTTTPTFFYLVIRCNLLKIRYNLEVFTILGLGVFLFSTCLFCNGCQFLK